jgi:hypothetical protein
MRAVPDFDSGRVVAAQLRRAPRAPWRVATTCKYGFAQVIASPSVLEDGERFPTWAYLTCPYLTKVIAAEESAGACERWTQDLKRRAKCAVALLDVDREVRRKRAAEGGGKDACADVGLAGQKSPLKVKCIHAHVAYALVGLNDPIGKEFLSRHSRTCADRRCQKFMSEED